MPRSCSSAAGQAPPYANDGLFGEFSRHRRYNNPIARDLMLDADTRDIGQKIANCAHTLKADVLIHPELKPEVNLKAAHVCNTRLCPFCEWRRARVWRKRLYGGLEALWEEQPKLRGLFLTLTVRNVPLQHLGDQLDQMNAAWHRLKNRANWPTPYWFRRTEVTVGYPQPDGECMAHPHFHVLLLVRPSYFTRDYIKQTTWQKMWMESARLDYAPVVDVRTAKTKSGGGSSTGDAAKAAIVEAAKYTTKAVALMELGTAISEFHQQLRHRRLYAVSKELRRFINDADPQGADLMDNDAKPLPIGSERCEVFARWFEDTQDYVITDINQP